MLKTEKEWHCRRTQDRGKEWRYHKSEDGASNDVTIKDVPDWGMVLPLNLRRIKIWHATSAMTEQNMVATKLETEKMMVLPQNLRRTKVVLPQNSRLGKAGMPVLL
jgi:hypothetical protein